MLVQPQPPPISFRHAFSHDLGMTVKLTPPENNHVTIMSLAGIENLFYVVLFKYIRTFIRSLYYLLSYSECSMDAFIFFPQLMRIFFLAESVLERPSV